MDERMQRVSGLAESEFGALGYVPFRVYPLYRPTLHTFQRGLLIRATKYANTVQGKRDADIRRRITAARVGARIKAKNGRVIRKGLCETSSHPPRAPDPVTHFSFQPHYAALRDPAVINEF